MPLTGTQLSVQLIPNNLYKTQRSNVTVVERNAYLEATVLAIGPGITDVAVNDIVMFPYSIDNANKTGAFIILRSQVVDIETPT